MPQLRNITEPKQLLVEGKDVEIIFSHFIEQLGISGLQIQDYGGVDELPGFLEQFVISHNFKSGNVVSLGIVRDAETGAEAAFQSICSALEKAKLTKPDLPLVAKGVNPKINILILPDSTTPGMLETLLLRAVANDPVMVCIDQYFECINQQAEYLPSPIDKAKALAFLASRQNIKPLLGHAARAGYWNFNSSVYDDVRSFLIYL
jgi:hypothetical protein